MLLNDKIVFVGHHIPRRERQAKIDEVRSHFTNLYIKNLQTEVTEPEFRELFEKYGKVTSAVVTKDADGKSKGFGFVNYEKHEDARKAVDELHDKEFRGQPLYVTRAQKKGEREEELRKSYEQAKYEKHIKYQGVNLYVKNLDDDMFVESDSLHCIVLISTRSTGLTKSSTLNSRLSAPSLLAKSCQTTRALQKVSVSFASLLRMKRPKLFKS